MPRTNSKGEMVRRILRAGGHAAGQRVTKRTQAVSNPENPDTGGKEKGDLRTTKKPG